MTAPLQTEKDILHIIQQDEWMMSLLRVVSSLGLPDWWIGAGFVRGKVWDYLHGYTSPTPLPDIDVVYFDPQDLSQESEQKEKEKLMALFPSAKWQVKNQARMHTFHNDLPYKNSSEGISRWVETATCIGVRLNNSGDIELTAPLGITDLVQLIVRQNPTILAQNEIFKKRITEKKWKELWPQLRIILE